MVVSFTFAQAGVMQILLGGQGVLHDRLARLVMKETTWIVANEERKI